MLYEKTLAATVTANAAELTLIGSRPTVEIFRRRPPAPRWADPATIAHWIVGGLDIIHSLGAYISCRRARRARI